MGKLMQINNMKLKFYCGKWRVIAPDGRVLEEFRDKKVAALWMYGTLDFLTPIGRKRKEI